MFLAKSRALRFFTFFLTSNEVFSCLFFTNSWVIFNASIEIGISSKVSFDWPSRWKTHWTMIRAKIDRKSAWKHLPIWILFFPTNMSRRRNSKKKFYKLFENECKEKILLVVVFFSSQLPLHMARASNLLFCMQLYCQCQMLEKINFHMKNWPGSG